MIFIRWVLLLSIINELKYCDYYKRCAFRKALIKNNSSSMPLKRVGWQEDVASPCGHF